LLFVPAPAVADRASAVQPLRRQKSVRYLTN
jgi:hypothetical protein